MPLPAIRPECVRAVVFDAVGTILTPRPEVAEAYYRHGQALGAVLCRDEVRRRFQRAFSDRFGGAPLEPCSEQSERELWAQVVREVFADQPVDHRRLFERLWDHFAQPRHWQLLPGVKELWPRLHRAGYRLAVASNFDRRLEAICRGKPPLHLARVVFTCSALGVRKPAVRFFQQIARRLELPPQGCLMVGDTLRADVLPALQAGWQAVWLRRETASEADSPAVPAIDHLEELAALLAG